MPIIDPCKYDSPPFYLVNGHFETIIPSIFNKVDEVAYQREQLELSDGDFLELDWLKNGHDRLVILSHGMEGSSHRHYVKRSAKFFHQRGWNVLAWNNRGCGGTINRLVKSYHHGTVQDITEVIDHALGIREYKSIVLIGFSMGGSMVSKYLSVTEEIDDRVKGGVTFSVSCDLHETFQNLETTIGIYKKKFLQKLKNKLLEKQNHHKELKDLEIATIDSFEEYHEIFTLPFHNYSSLNDFYRDASCLQFLPTLQKPLLMVNALNDPLLGEKCYPVDLAQEHPLLFLETPTRGGHLGFTIPKSVESYMEIASQSFINEHIMSFV